MEIFLEQIINGLVQGSVYALVALGYTMVYGILGLINFAHGEVVMVGAMLALSSLAAMLGWGVPPLLALPLSLALAMLGCMVLGYGIERIAYRPLRHAPRLAPLITAIGVSIVLQNLAMMIWGRQYHAFPQLFDNASHLIGGAIINDIQIIIFIVALAIMAVLGANVFGIFSVGLWKTFNKYVNLNVIGQIGKKIRKDPTVIIVAPITFFVGLIEIIGEFAKIASLSFRLFGNVFAGEVLLVSMAALVGYIVPIPFLFLEILVGLIQALIFSILLVVYFTIGATDHDEHEEKSSSPSQDGHEVVIIN